MPNAQSISLESAKHLARWRVLQEAESPKRNWLERAALKTKGPQSVDEIFTMLNEMGFCIAYKDPEHQFVKSALANGSIHAED